MASASAGKRSDGGLDPVFSFKITFRRIGAGLQNLGNTCYLNSVLQCLTYTEPFAAYCHSGDHKSSCRNAGFCAMCALQNHVMNALQSSGKILSPLHIVKNLRCISRKFRNSRQEDAHEYMVNLLESMHKCCLPSGVPTESPSAHEKSLVHKIFGGCLRSQVKCTQCNYCSNKIDPFLDLSLEISKADSLRKALSHFTATEQLDGGERQYQCQRCKEKVRAHKQLTIHKAPYVLTIHLKRFGHDICGEKIDKKVDFEPSLNLKPFVSDQQEADLKYTLYGVLVHAGWSTHSGHYYCFVRTSSGMWHSLDDNQVRPVSEKSVLSQKAYMLFYVHDRSSAIKRPVGGVCKDNILANAPGHQVIPQPTLNISVQKAEHGSIISESRPVKSEAVSLAGSLSEDGLSVQENGNAIPKEASVLRNNGHDVKLAELKENTVGKCTQTVLKQKKLGRSLQKVRYLGRKQLFLTSVLLQRRKKHKWRKHHLHSKKAVKDEILEDLCVDDQCVSTSESVKLVDVASLPSSSKRLRSKPNKENTTDKANGMEYCNGEFVQNPLNSSENQCDVREVMDLLKSLEENTVPRWDDVELSSSQSTKDLDDGRNKNTGYVLDEWDEDYDRGKRKKVRKSKSLFGETSNPFQEMANMQIQRNMKMESCGNQPLRI